MGTAGNEPRMGAKGYELNKGWKASEYPTNGWWDHADEVKVTQPRFYLGHKKDAAEVAALRIEQLWKQVKDNQHVAFANVEIDFGTSKMHGKPPRPLWSPLTLEMAYAIAKGATTFQVPRRSAKQHNLEYVKYLAEMRRAFPVIQLIAEDEQGFAEGQAVAQGIAHNAREHAKALEFDAGNRRRSATAKRTWWANRKSRTSRSAVSPSTRRKQPLNNFNGCQA